MIGSAMTAWGESEEGLASAPWLARTALVERLASTADGGGVAVIAAEAGTGKSDVLRQWLATRADDGVHVADIRTESGFDAALQLLSANSGTTVVIDRVDALAHDRLVQLDACAAERPDRTALIVASRKDPRLSNTGLQLAGEDLAWSTTEVAEALRRWGRSVTDDQAEEVAWISEGWCAAVRLAAAVGPAVLRDESATLDHQLMRDAAAMVSPELLAAAIELSAVDQFDAATVDALLDPPDRGAAVIEALLRNRLFLRPTGTPGVWRFHRLFLRAARRELRSGRSAAAARWPAHVMSDPAAVSRRFLAPHAGVSSLTDDMLNNDLLAAHAIDLLLDGALEAPSASALVRTTSSSQLGRAAIGLAALTAGDVGAAELALEGVDDPRDPVSGGLAAVSALLRARHAGDLVATATAARAIASTAPDDGRKALAWLELGTLEFDLGESRAGEEHLELAASLADHAERPALAARAWAALAVLAASEARLRTAEERLELVDERATRCPEGLVRAALARASIAFQRDDLDAALQHADAARRAAAGSWDPVLSLYVLLTEIAVLEGQGHDALAMARLAEADVILPRCPPSLFHATTLEIYRVRLLDRSGRAHEAARLLEDIDKPGHPVLTIAEARRHMRADDPAGALAALRPDLDASGRPPDEIRPPYLLLYAAAVDRLGDADAAHDALERALGLAEAEGFLRAFVDEGLPARTLLERHLKRPTAHAAFIQELLDHLDARRPAPEADLRAPLTDRELVVLGYLPSEMTARDIAEALTVSETTVRTHMRHIYEKLDAGGRRRAVRRARQLRLLSPQ
jgi:LuxR family maltose regulon positive regulatory protein